MHRKSEERYFENKFDDNEVGLDRWKVPSSELDNLRTRIADVESRIFEYLKSAQSRDSSVYTGTAGIVLMYEHLIRYHSAVSSAWHEHFSWALATLKPTRRHSDPPSFLLGEAGVQAVTAYGHHLQAHRAELTESERASALAARDAAIARVFKLFPGDDADSENELLYGRTGYLYALQFIARQCDGMPDHGSKGFGLTADQRTHLARASAMVASAILKLGERYAQRKYVAAHGPVPPVMWEWMGERYLGAGHGVAGNLYILLSLLDQSDDARRVLFAGVDYLIDHCRTREGNLYTVDDDEPSAPGKVHWCHGAPALSLLCAHAFRNAAESVVSAERKQRFLQVALDSGEIVWRKGLLRKGPGLCHGISGNGYVLLRLWEITRDKKWLRRAWHFANFASESGEHIERLWATPDHPYSLYEGLAGAVCFWSDVCRAISAAQVGGGEEAAASEFPGFDLPGPPTSKTATVAKA